ncbi:nitrite/sulfite reductase [bacterium]|nr:nitrite/sulfite reductase [bacterium]
MAAVDDPNSLGAYRRQVNYSPFAGGSAPRSPPTLGRTRLSFADEADVDDFVSTLEKFERGEIGPDQWRAFRLVRGTYGQRQTDGESMLRVKIPQGVLEAPQLHALADVAEQWSRGFGHLTTRQNLQFHFMRLHDVEHAMRRLGEAGLTTREACGNAVRNVTCCPYAGVAEDELFDVTPYAEAITRHLLRHPLSASLPRKFKIAVEGCEEDHLLTAINDLGFRARLGPGGERGFRVTVGGGTATWPVSGALLSDFVPAGEILNVAEAVLRIFHALGDREHRNRNRLKFLMKELGPGRWRREYDETLAKVVGEGGTALPFPPDEPLLEAAPDRERASAPSVAQAAARAKAATVRGPGILPVAASPAPFPRWLATNVRRQKQDGFRIVTVTLPLGDLTGAQMRVLADLALAYGDGTVRVTGSQDLLFRWVRTEHVSDLFRRLAAAGLGLPDADTVADVTSCPGAESCRLAVTQSRGLGKLLGDFLRDRPELVALVPDLRIKISGCPNGCGQHHVAGIGFQGSVRKVGGRAVPQYFLMVGGGVDDAGARFARIAAKVPARRIPRALDGLFDLYSRERRDGETATAFFQRVELSLVKETVRDLETLGDEVTPDDFVDLGEAAAFAPEVLEGECAR